MTNPSRWVSKGRLARSGSLLRVESAFMALNPPTPGAVLIPRAAIMHRIARWIHLNARDGMGPVAHAVTTLMFGPAPKRMEICPANR